MNNHPPIDHMAAAPSGAGNQDNNHGRIPLANQMPLQQPATPMVVVSPPDPKCPQFLAELTPEASVLRDYQRKLLMDASQAMSRARRICLQSPTGSGKTHCISAVADAAIAWDLRVLILATRTRLVRQLSERLDSFRIEHGILAASMPGYVNWSKRVQVASVDTLYRRCMVSKKMPLPIADVVVFDEAHLALGRTRQEILDAYPAAWVFGFTATPAKTSGASLSDQFDELVLGPSVLELIQAGSLVRPMVFSKPVMDAGQLAKVKTDSKSGDYQTASLTKMMRRPKLVGDVIQNWLRIANGKRTLVFACHKGHGQDMVDEFIRAGVGCELMTDNDDEDTREQIIARLEAGITKVVVNCFLLAYGIDIPCVECIVLARPTKSIVLYLQAVGRGMRPSPGKERMILIDCGRVVENLGPPAYDRDWSLTDANANKSQAEKMGKERHSLEEKQRTCKECGCMWLTTEDGNKCPSCGWQFTPRPKPVEVQQAQLVGGDDGIGDWPAIDRFHGECCGRYIEKWPERWREKPSSGRFWAWAKCREKFKRPEDERIPRRYWETQPKPPTDETLGWLKYQEIKYAKSRRGSPA